MSQLEYIKSGQIIKMRNRLWRVDEFSGNEIIAAPISGDSDDRRVFLVDLERIESAGMDPISKELPGDFAAQQLLL